MTVLKWLLSDYRLQAFNIFKWFFGCRDRGHKYRRILYTETVQCTYCHKVLR